MSARDWIEKDYYGELGVSSSASQDEIKRAYRKLARELHPDANPGDSKAENRFKAVSEAYGVLGDPEQRAQYDEARQLFGAGAGAGAGSPGGFGAARGGFGGGGVGGFDLGDMFAQPGGGAGGLGDLLGGLFGDGGQGPAGFGAGSATRPQRGSDVETDVQIGFGDAVRGATVALRLSSPATCGSCSGTGARAGTSPRACPTCSGAGVVHRSQGTFAFSEPCRDCRGRGHVVDHPCPECSGSGVSTRTRSLTMRVPAGVTDGQRIRLAGQGEPGRHGAAAGDLYARVHVTPHPVFGRSETEPADLTMTVPVSLPELALGTTLTVPTLEGSVSLRVAPGTASGRTLRVRGRGIERRTGRAGDLLVTLQVAVPGTLDATARQALQAYADATAGDDPRAELWRAAGATGATGHRQGSSR